MKAYHPLVYFLTTVLFLINLPSVNLYTQALTAGPDLDKKVEKFLKGGITDYYMNVPESDGKLLFDIIVKNGYKNALEIGTSTGISSIWIAWALSKTGGKLITIEIDENRHKTALKNFKAAGLSEYIDARLGNAHEIVPELEGPFDFVFSDADKDWYKNYFIAIDPKLKVNGCYTSHNVSERVNYGWQSEYLQFLKQKLNYQTTVNHNGSGMAISYKKSEK